MFLIDWLRREGIRRADFARNIGVSPAWVTLLCDGRGWPSRAVAERIANATKDEVTAADFVRAPSIVPDAAPAGEEVAS